MAEVPTAGSNRTIVGLKDSHLVALAQTRAGSNRTIVGLKGVLGGRQQLHHCGIETFGIERLWREVK